MKRKLLVLATIAALTALTSQADTYPDPTGDIMPSNAILDITSVDVTNTATDIVFKIKLAGNPVATDWGKYCIGINNNDGLTVGDSSPAGNGWVRPINIDASLGGMTHWVGSWANSGNGAQLWSYNAGWSQGGASVTGKTTNSITITFPFASLGVNFGSNILFDVYTTGGGSGDSAVDALSRSTASIAAWGGPFTSTSLSNYTLQVVTAVPHTVKFSVDMGVPIWEFDNPSPGINGFDTNFGAVYVRGSFNGWAGIDAMVRKEGTTRYTNSITFDATPGDMIQYKFDAVTYPGYESPIFTGGANRTLTLTNTSMTADLVGFGDRRLSDPPVSTVNFSVDMSVARNFGVFDPAFNNVTLRGNFNDWGNSLPALPLTPGNPPNTNIYSGSITYNYYPIAAQNIGAYKFFITDLINDNRDNGWEAPISTGGGNRSFSIAAISQNLAFVYNDENPVINAMIQQLNPSDVKISFNSFPFRGGFPGYPTGGVYAVESATSLSGPWTTNVILYSTTANTAVTNSGVLPVNSQQFYRVGLIGL